jgi:outer membrane protein
MKIPIFLPAIVLGCACNMASLSYAAESLATARIRSGSTLEEFFTAAINYSPQLKIAEENLNISSARKRAANGQLLPHVSANASLSDNRQNALNQQLQNFDGERYSLQLTQVLFNWEAFASRKQASLLEDQNEAIYFAQLAFLLTDVSEKYFAVLQAGDALESIGSELEAVRNQLDQIQSFYDRQLVQITDLYDVQARVAAVRSEQLGLQSQLELAREALRSVTGVLPGELFRLDEAAEVPPVERDIDYWVRQARNNNQQIQASEYALQAADKGIDGRRGAYMPRVSLIAQRQDSNLGFDNSLISQTDSTFIGLDISIPLYAGGRNRAAMSEAISLHSIAENELRQTQLNINESTRTAFLQVKSSELRTEAAEILAESTALLSEARQQGFELGVVTSVDVLNALRDQFRAERDLQQARYEHILYFLMLKRETGTLSAEDLLEVGTWLIAPED